MASGIAMKQYADAPIPTPSTLTSRAGAVDRSTSEVLEKVLEIRRRVMSSEADNAKNGSACTPSDHAMFSVQSALNTLESIHTILGEILAAL